MDLPLTYGQCLRRIMKNNRLSINTLCRKMGYHSTTQLNRILSDEVSPTLITKFHHQFMLIFDWLISPAEIRELSTSLQYSCLGQDAFLSRRAMHSMLFERTAAHPQTICLRLHREGRETPCTLQDMLRILPLCKEAELLILGSLFDPLLTAISSHAGRGAWQGRLRIRHYFVMEESAAKLISRVSALTPFLNTRMYEGAYCTDASPDAVRFLTQNQIALARVTFNDGACRTLFFLPQQKDGMPVCQMDGDALYQFYDAQIRTHQERMRPVKSVYPKPKTVDSLLTLCQRDLFLEQGRACCFVRLDLCFPVLPLDVIIAAADGGARLGMTMEDPLLVELMRVHEARYQNMMHKQEPTCFILSRSALTDFAHTGHMSDHLFALRNFTPAERRAIIAPLVCAMRSGSAIDIRFLLDDTLAPVSSFAAYADMGVQISANNTAYNVADNHDEVFISLPEFEESFSAYCMNTLLPEYCMTREDSLALLDRLLLEIDNLPEE